MQGLPLAWSELAAPGAPVRLDEAAHWTFVRSTFPSWLWKLGRFELRVPLPTNEVVKLLKKRKSGDILVAGGGIIPEADVPKLKKAGIKVVFGPGTPLRDIVAFFETAGKGA